jgi:hypothetical protein
LGAGGLAPPAGAKGRVSDTFAFVSGLALAARVPSWLNSEHLSVRASSATHVTGQRDGKSD